MKWRIFYRHREDPEREAWRRARRMGFDAHNFTPSFWCIFWGRHTNVELYGPNPDCGKLRWSAVAKCCQCLNGNIYVEDPSK